MGIFGKDSNGTVQPSRSRRASSTTASASSVPVSIVPAPPQGHNGAFLKTNSSNATSVFGRQQSWSDQIADSSLLKGKPSSGFNTPPQSHYGNGSSSTTTAPNDVKFVHSTMEILENQIKREEAPKKKRTRTSTEQLRILQKAFQTDPMPNSSARCTLSKKLGMSSRAVQVWFQNRRAKEKLDSKRNVMGLSGTSSFTYEEDDVDGEQDDDDEINFDEEASTDSSSSAKASEFAASNSMKALGMMGRMAFNAGDSSTSNAPIKSQRSLSTPNGFYPQSRVTPSNKTGHYSANSPFCHLFPGEHYTSNVNEASVDQLYQDLGGVSGANLPSPIDDACTFGGSASAASSSSNFFTFGDPFYGGGIIDRTPSVSPVGFGSRSQFYPIGQSFDFMIPTFNDFNSMNSSDSFTSFNVNSSLNACKGLSGGNVYLTTSIGSASSSSSGLSSNIPNTSTVANTATSSNRRSFSLPQTHGNLSFQQMQQLENFGMQVFPSPLLSINEEEGGLRGESLGKSESVNRSSQGGNNNKSSDFLLPFPDFLDGEVIRWLPHSSFCNCHIIYLK